MRRSRYYVMEDGHHTAKMHYENLTGRWVRPLIGACSGPESSGWRALCNKDMWSKASHYFLDTLHLLRDFYNF